MQIVVLCSYININSYTIKSYKGNEVGRARCDFKHSAAPLFRSLVTSLVGMQVPDLEQGDQATPSIIPTFSLSVNSALEWKRLLHTGQDVCKH